MTSEELKYRLHSRLVEALYHLFPAGKIIRNTFVIGNIQGHAGDSLSVGLSSGKAGLWYDFATGEGGDIFGLWGAAHGWDYHTQFPQIAGSIQDWLGMPPHSYPHELGHRKTESRDAKLKAQGEWRNGGDAAGHPYLEQKKVGCHGIKAKGGNNTPGQLLIPARDVDGNLHTLQTIDDRGRKFFLKGGVKKGHFHTIGELDTHGLCYVAEGYATAASVYEATAIPTICAFDAGNIEPVIEAIRGKYPGLSITIAADNDSWEGDDKNSGVNAARRCATRFSGVNFVYPTFNKDHYSSSPTDFNDLYCLSGLEEVRRQISQVIQGGMPEKGLLEESTIIEPLPLGKQLEKARDYPIEALGSLLGGAALDICDKIQAPLAICAQSVLANAALVAQGHLNIRLPFGQTSPTSLYLVSVSESGGRKSAADKEASVFIKEREQELRQKYDQDIANYANAKDAFDALRKKILNDNKSDNSQQNLENALSALGSPPTPPLDVLLTVPEPTFEGICAYFMRGQPSIGLFSDEGGQFISGYGMDADNKIKTAAGLSSLWSGDPIKRMRGGDGTIVLPGKRLSMHLMVQPGIVDKLLSDTELLQQGILSRLLVVFPYHLFGTRLSTNEKRRNGCALQDFNRRMLKIARQELPTNPTSKRNELTPRILEMTPDAAGAFYRFSDAIEVRLKTGGDLKSIRGFCSKLAEQASRIAAILAFAEDPEVACLEKHYFDRGAIIAEYYAYEALRLFGSALIPPYILKAEALLEWLKYAWPSKTTTPGLISLPDVCIFGPNKIRRKALASSALKTLEDHGWLVREGNGAVINGKRRKDAWRVRREFFDDCAEKQTKASDLANSGNGSELGEQIFFAPERDQEEFLEDSNLSSPVPASLPSEENAGEREGMNI